ncbi:UNVERIFIED_ORG: fibronectin type III domain-containing protein [Shinella sp. XGS7]|nr:fibronectin type III domain-containing protein [Shinella sp. XGS7]
MKQHNSLPSLMLGVAWLLLLTACGGGGGDGPRVRDEAQQIALETPPRLLVGGTASLRAIASSGLPVSYASLSPQSCQVDAGSGLVQSLAAAPCVIGISQSGNASWAPAPSQQITLQPEAATQSLSFAAAPVLRAGGSASLSATASSGLAVRYSSLSPEICSVEAESGRLLGLQAGNCRIAADQAGDARWSPAPQALLQLEVLPDPQQRISFGPAPTLTLGSQARVSATASSGLPVRYSSLSASVCSVEASSGQVQSLSLGDCVIAADQAGDALHEPAPRVLLSLSTQPGASPPGPPQGVSARLGGDVRSVLISLGAVDSGGSPISAYSVQSQPAGITASGSSLPLRVSCPASCAGYRFTVAAENARGAGPASAAAEVITEFDITTVFREPDTQPRDTIFIGRITLNSSTGQLSGLKGVLTESMTGAALGSAPLYDMVQVPLNYQLKSWSDAALGGSFAASFAKNSISTFATLGGGDGWSPAAGVAVGGVYAGFPASYAGTVKNSYVLVFVPQDPFAPLTPAQLAKLAYADCAPGGMMGATCMTGTSVAGYGALGTMSGYPLSQTLSPR